MTRTITASLILTAGLALSACEKQTEQSEPQAAAPDSPAQVGPIWLLTSMPADAKSVTEAKAEASEGQQIAVRGRIGGRLEPISSDSPVFTIVDMELQHCGQLEGDSCPSPWDYCCEPQENLRAHAATVQLVTESGEPLDIDPVAGGLDALDEVIIVGTVGPRPSADVLTIKATGVHVVGG